MGRTIGVLVSDHIAAALVEDHAIAGELHRFPSETAAGEALQTMPAERIGQSIAELVESVAGGEAVDAIGVGF